MDLYILDSSLRRTIVLDHFISLIWTERFVEVGDFELVLAADSESRSVFRLGTRLAIEESLRVMAVDTLEDSIDDEGRSLLTIKGRSLEAILDDRVARESTANTTTKPTWKLVGTPGAAARQIFKHICVDGALNALDKIPFYTTGNPLPPDTLQEPPTSVTIEIEPMTVYSAIKQICDSYELGFRLIRGLDTSKLYFNIYAGSDKTSGQLLSPAVIFSSTLDNLSNIKEFSSSAYDKTVAYVVSPVGFVVVYSPYSLASSQGFNRKVLLVNADDITETNATTATTLMTQRGREELSKARTFTMFDGEIGQNVEYVYGVDYQLGDIVELRNGHVTTEMRVTEHIFVSDADGVKSYPTLTYKQALVPGTWHSWEYNEAWQDLNNETWKDI
jgi:hypothetical protein